MKTLISLIPIIVFSLIAQAQNDPKSEFKEIKVKNFYLIYDAKHQDLAELYAQRLNTIGDVLHPLWQEHPKSVVLGISDRTDLTNGYATFLPQPTMMFFPVLPAAFETIGQYNDWAWELLVHEYTHILSFEQRKGIVRGLSWVYGSIITPTALTPRWSLEGVAVENETRYSKGGRLRSDLQEASLRAMALTGRISTYKFQELNESSIPTWPYGARPYLFGSLIWNQITDEVGPKAGGDFYASMGGLPPYFLTYGYDDVFKKRARTFFSEAIVKVQEVSQQQLKEIGSDKITEGLILDPENFETNAIAISPDGLKAAYISRDHTLKRKVQVLVRADKSVSFKKSDLVKNFGDTKNSESSTTSSPFPRAGIDEDAPPAGQINRISWSADSTQFVHDQFVSLNRFHQYSNLWLYNLNSGKPEQLTFIGRAREPSLSPDGKWVAFVEVEAGVCHLGLLELATKKTQRLWQAPLQDRVSFPEWLNDDQIIFSNRHAGQEQAFLISKSGGQVKLTLEKMINPLSFSRQDSKLSFTATNNGVRNLYETDLSLDNIRPLTNSATLVTQGQIDSSANQLLFTEMTDQGFQIKQIALNSADSLPKKLSPLKTKLYKEPATFNLPEFETSTKFTDKAQDYAAYEYLFPKYWLPLISSDSNGLSASIATGGADPMGVHAYAISASYDASIKRYSGFLTYRNQSFWPSISITGYDYSTKLATYSQMDRYQGAGILFSDEIQTISPDWIYGFGFFASNREKLGVKSSRQGPRFVTAYDGASASGEQISPESGWEASLVVTNFENEKNRPRDWVTEASIAKYFAPSWFPKRHALAWKMSGTYSDHLQNFEYLDSSSQAINSNSVLPTYLVRGYPSGTFLGEKLLVTNMEYRFPVWRARIGLPEGHIYFHQVSGALVYDSIYLDSLVYDFNAKAYSALDKAQIFGSAGIETRWDFNLGFAFMTQWILGVHWPLDKKVAGSTAQLSFGLQF